MSLFGDVAYAKVLGLVANLSFDLKKIERQKLKSHAVSQIWFRSQRGSDGLGRKSLQLIRYFVEFDSGHISIPQGLTAYSLISEPLSPIRSSPKPATKALPVAVMLKLWLSVLRCQTARGCCIHSWHHTSFRFTYGRTQKKNGFCSHIRILATLYFLPMIEFVFSIFFFRNLT